MIDYLIKYAIHIFFTIWFIIIISAVSTFQVPQQFEFDPEHQLENAALDPTFSQQFTATVQRYTTNMIAADSQLNNTIVHFTREHCNCQMIAQPHIDSVIALGVKHNFKSVTLDLSTPAPHVLQQWIPSTPAVAVFNQQGQLIYLGPYASGYFCSEGNGLVEPFIHTAQNHTRSIAAVITQSSGCYSQSLQY
ncbi:DUF6436 domain-containing protein [Algibacillus agarilyticus]|uniref:DUF6436 domain-containing protein n=1 Tax=Algibacillus agarilyticus TaxID=2234133 RepID=UPI000DCF9B55|nr:DUF6436 domain-containing protein [Algibacillus agarilyticus]